MFPSFSVIAVYQKQDQHSELASRADIPLRSRYTKFFSFDKNLRQLILRKFRVIRNREEDFLLAGSGWTFLEISEIRIETLELHGINNL